MSRVTIEELNAATSVMLKTIPAQQLADQVIMLSSLVEVSITALEKYPSSKDIAEKIKAQLKRILLGPLGVE